MASVNDDILLVEGAGTLMNTLYKEVTGAEDLTALPSGDFVSVANATAKMGWDPVMQGLSRILSRTIFAVRPYNSKLSFLQVDSRTWGRTVRKIHPVDDPAFRDADITPLPNGESVDPFIIHKRPSLQVMYYGSYPYQMLLTKFEVQLRACFFNESEFASFIGMIITEMENEIQSADEGVARMCIANLVIGTKLSDDAGYSVGEGHRVIHAITAYNTYYGYNSGDAGYLNPADSAAAMKNKDFWKWLYTDLKFELELMASRTQYFHTAVTNKPITKHTPEADRKILVNSRALESFKVYALSDTFHDNYLREGENVESLAYWQNPETPYAMKCTPTYLKNDGTLIAAEEATELDNIIMVVFDKDACGFTKLVTNVEAIRNPRNMSTNLWYTWESQLYNDFLENAFVVTLD